jgi:hypothetical protein
MVRKTLFLKRRHRDLEVRKSRETGTTQGRSPREGASATGRGTNRLKSAAPSARDRSFGAAAPASPFSVTLPGSRSRRGGADGPQRPEARPGLPAQSVRGRSTSTTAFRTPGLADSSRAAVTGASNRASSTPSAASGLTADPAHNRPPSAGSGKARPADLPADVAVDAPNYVGAPGTATVVRATAASAPRSSPADIRTALHLTVFTSPCERNRHHHTYSQERGN